LTRGLQGNHMSLKMKTNRYWGCLANPSPNFSLKKSTSKHSNFLYHINHFLLLFKK